MNEGYNYQMNVFNLRGLLDEIIKINQFQQINKVCQDVLLKIEENISQSQDDIQKNSDFGDQLLRQQQEEEQTGKQIIIFPTRIQTYPNHNGPVHIANIHLFDGFPAIVSQTIYLNKKKLKSQLIQQTIMQMMDDIAKQIKIGMKQQDLIQLVRAIANQNRFRLIGNTILFKLITLPLKVDLEQKEHYYPFINADHIEVNETYNLNLSLTFNSISQDRYINSSFKDSIQGYYNSHQQQYEQVFQFSSTYHIFEEGPIKIWGFPYTQDQRVLEKLFQKKVDEFYNHIILLIQEMILKQEKMENYIQVLELQTCVDKELFNKNHLFKQIDNNISTIKQILQLTLSKLKVSTQFEQQFLKIKESLQSKLDLLALNNQNINQRFLKNKFRIGVIFSTKCKEELDDQELQALDKICGGSIEVYNYFACQNQKLGLSQDDFDPQYNKEWNFDESKHQMIQKKGPPQHRYDYYPPLGYSGYALNVKNKYEDNQWLGSDGSEGEWRILYHGTNHEHLKKIIRGGFIQGKSQQYQNDLCELLNQKVGKGIYFSDKVQICVVFTKETIIGEKQFILVLQVRVNPKVIKQSFTMQQLNYFLVNNPKDIRPYRILLKQV